MRSRLAVVIFFCLAVVLVASGCAKKRTGVQLSEQTTASMLDVKQSLIEASAQIDATNASLNDVIRTGESGAQPENVKASYEAYSDNVRKMDQTAKMVNKHIDQMTTRGNDYFQEWGKSGGSYTDPQMQKLSAQERNRLTQSFADISSASAGMRGSLNAYLAEIKQIQTYLSNNLTTAGLSAVAPIAQAAARDGAELKRSFQPVQTAIERARVEMMPGGAAAGGTPGQAPQQNITPEQQAPQGQQLQPLDPQQNQPQPQQPLNPQYQQPL